MLIVRSKGIDYIEGNFEWDDLPEPIDRMEFKISKNKYVCFEGFEKYIRLKEFCIGINKNINEMTKIILMGQSFGKVAIITVDCKTGKFSQEEKKLGHEYYNKPTNPRLWKEGVSGKAIIYLREVED